MKKKLLILFGGASSEHEVSCLSAASVLRHLDENKYEIYKVGITKEGNWFLTDSPVSDIEEGRWTENPGNRRASLSPDTFVRGMILYGDNGVCVPGSSWKIRRGRNCTGTLGTGGDPLCRSGNHVFGGLYG